MKGSKRGLLYIILLRIFCYKRGNCMRLCFRVNLLTPAGISACSLLQWGLPVQAAWLYSVNILEWNKPNNDCGPVFLSSVHLCAWLPVQQEKSEEESNRVNL
jgi:hypothetical protein